MGKVAGNPSKGGEAVVVPIGFDERVGSVRQELTNGGVWGLEWAGDGFIRGSAVESKKVVAKKRDGGSVEIAEHDDRVLQRAFSAR